MTRPLKIISKKEYEKKFKKPNQEEVWNSIAIPWKTYVVKPIPIVEEFLKNKKGKVIDLGCGSGRNLIPNENLEYYCVDFSEAQLNYAREYSKNKNIKAKFFKLSLDKLSKKYFKDNFFDYGIFIASLHCLDSKKKREKALKEFFRILKPGGEALISVWNSEDKRFNCVNNHGDIYMSWEKDRIPYMRYYYLFYKQEFLDLIKKTGFKILEFYKPREHDRFSKKNWIVRVKK